MKKIISVFIAVLLITGVPAGSAFAEEVPTDVETTRSDQDYSYMFERGTSQKSSISLDEVERIAILFTSSPLPQSLFLDMEDMKSYYDPGRDIYYNIQVSKYINDLTDSERTQLESIWQKGDFESWDFYYEGYSEPDYECHLSVETKNALYHYEIRGVDAPAPDSLTDFITEVLHAFWNPQIIS